MTGDEHQWRYTHIVLSFASVVNAWCLILLKTYYDIQSYQHLHAMLWAKCGHSSVDDVYSG